MPTGVDIKTILNRRWTNFRLCCENFGGSHIDQENDIDDKIVKVRLTKYDSNQNQLEKSSDVEDKCPYNCRF